METFNNPASLSEDDIQDIKERWTSFFVDYSCIHMILELGGKSPFIVCEDADIEKPVEQAHVLFSLISYFVVANAIACAYAALSLLIALTNRGKIKGLGTLVTVLDALMVALLFSCNGAAIAVGVLGFQGNSHVGCNKVCNVFGKFCNQTVASFIISLLGSIAFLLLVVVPALRLHRRT